MRIAAAIGYETESKNGRIFGGFVKEPCEIHVLIHTKDTKNKPIRILCLDDERTASFISGKADFGKFSIDSPKFVVLKLFGPLPEQSYIELISTKGDETLNFNNISKYRSAPSIHVWWEFQPKSTQINAFYNEIFVTDDPLYTYCKHSKCPQHIPKPYNANY